MNIFNSKSININSLNVIKNSIQYLITTVLYFIIFGTVSLNFLLGLIGFLIAYQSVYYFNDLMDYREDKKSEFKKKTKLLARGSIRREIVESYSFLFAIIGLTISFMVNNLFGLLVVICLLLNFLHSSSFIRLKKSNLLLPNLFLIESIKYSLGWFALTSSIAQFPFYLIIFLSLIYLIGYIYWKQNITNFFKSTKTKVLFGLCFVFYLISFFSYPFKLALLFPMFFGGVFYIFKRFKSSLIRLKIGYTLVFVISFCFLLSIILLTTPTFAEINNEIAKNVDIIKENVTNIVPQDIKQRWINIEDNIICNIDNLTNNLNKRPL